VEANNGIFRFFWGPLAGPIAIARGRGDPPPFTLPKRITADNWRTLRPKDRKGFRLELPEAL